MKSPAPEPQYTEGVFLMQSIPSLCCYLYKYYVKVRLNMAQPLKLLIKYINFKYKYFHNSVDWSGRYLQANIHSLLPKISRFIYSFYHEKDLQKGSSMFSGGRHYALAPLKNHVGVYAPSIFARKCRLKLNILNMVKSIV